MLAFYKKLKVLYAYYLMLTIYNCTQFLLLARMTITNG